MKDQVSLIISIAVLAYAAVRIYQKYFKKENINSDKSVSDNKRTGFPPSKGSDDYEPYLKK